MSGTFAASLRTLRVQAPLTSCKRIRLPFPDDVKRLDDRIVSTVSQRESS
jgi:hypothetical protein